MKETDKCQALKECVSPEMSFSEIEAVLTDILNTLKPHKERELKIAKTRIQESIFWLEKYAGGQNEA